MRRIVFVILGLFAVFTLIRAYEVWRQPTPESREEISTGDANYADIGPLEHPDTENL